MNISYFGLTCFRIQNNGASVLIDPYEDTVGLKLPRMQNDLTLYTKTPDKAKSDQSFAITVPGEYEVKDIFIYAMPVASSGGNAEGLIYLIETEGIYLVHLGALKKTKFNEQQLERLKNLDMLMLPVGGGDCLNADQASELIAQLEPRLVIPMNYQLPGLKQKLEPLDKFKKAIGGNFETVDKLKISRKDLPEEDTNYVIIEPSAS